MAMTDSNPLFRIATLLDDLKHDEISIRVNSMRHLKEITEALGVERTRDELLPFLGDTVMDDEDEVLLVAAEEFGDLVKQVGGVDHIPSLLKVLEELASVDEPTVRAKAVESIYKLVAQMKKDAINKHFVPIVKRLATKEWFTARSASCALFTAAYPQMSEDVKAELRGLFGNLCKDDTPTVRKAAAENIGKFAAVIDPNIIKDEIYPLFQELSKDQQDSVRLQTAKNVIAFTQIEKKPEKKKEILKTVFTLAEDNAWRVKWTVADSFVDIAALVVDNKFETDYPRFVRLFVKLMVDEEPEVRAAAINKLTLVGRRFKEPKGGAQLFADEVIPQLGKLVQDSSEFVRTEMASVILGLAPVVGQQKAIEYLVPLYLQLLRDTDSQVRLNLIASLDSMDETVPISYINDVLLPSIEDLATDGQWRIRHSIIGHIPLVAKHLGKDLFDRKLVQMCINWLQDEVFSIRQAATENLQKLTLLFGEQWAKEQLFDKIEELSMHASYLFRMQAIRSIEGLATVVGINALNLELIPHLMRLSQDATPNIRFNVAKCIEKIAPKLSQPVLKQDVKPKLVAMLTDSDEDVKYFAGRALEVVNRQLGA